MKPCACLRINVMLVCLCMSINAFACSTAAWFDAVGAYSANNPANGVSKVSGSCGFKVTGLGYVQDNSPDSEAQFIGRFYFFPQFSGAGSADIFVAYSNNEASTELFSVTYDAGNVTIDSTAAGGGSASVPINGAGWHLIEFAWISGESGSLWVDADAEKGDPADATFASGSGMVESVRLGAPNGFVDLSGEAFFDDYVSQRVSPIGGILAGDGNLDGVIDSSDIDAIKSEFLFGDYPQGSTDCNFDGETNSGDVNCVVEQLP